MIQYIELVKKILTEGSTHKDRTGTGTIRIFGHGSRYNLKDGFPLVTVKKTSLRLIAEELIWFLSGSTDEKKLAEKGVNIWSGNGSAEECAKFGRAEGDLGGIYGHTWRNWGATKREIPLESDYWSEKNKRWVNRSFNDDGTDQIKNLVEQIKQNPNSRRHVVVAFDPVLAKETNPPPCHSFWQVIVEDGKISLSLTMRSNDIFLGAGFNIAQYSLLVHLLAIVCDLEPGSFYHHVNDAHIYLDHIDQCKEMIARTPYPLPQIKINERLKGQGFDGLLDFKWSDLELIGYKAHPTLKGKMSV
jgi:thymidylate synthase